MQSRISRIVSVVACVAMMLIFCSLTAFAEIRSLTAKERAQYSKLSPFEFKDVLIATARNTCDAMTATGQACRIYFYTKNSKSDSLKLDRQQG